MPFGALLGAGLSLIGSKIAGDSAKDAARTQAQSGEQAQKILREDVNSAIANLAKASNESIAALEGFGPEAVQRVRSAVDQARNLLQETSAENIQTIDSNRAFGRDVTEAGLRFARKQLQSSADSAMAAINASRDRAQQAIRQGVATGRTDLTTALSQGRTDLQAGLNQVNQDTQPFYDTGVRALGEVEELITDPNRQKDFITNNPFFDTLTKRSRDEIFANQAARGKVGSGGTADALQESLLALGSQLLDKNISQRFGLVDVGLNAVGQRSAAAQNTSRSLAALEQSTGMSLAQLAAQEGRDVASVDSQAAARGAQIAQSLGMNLAELGLRGAEQLAQIESQSGRDMITERSNTAANLTNLGVNEANTVNAIQGGVVDATNAIRGNAANAEGNWRVNAGNNLANIEMGIGNANAAGQVAQGTAFNTSLQDIGNIAMLGGFDNLFGGNRNTGLTADDYIKDMQLGGAKV